MVTKKTKVILSSFGIHEADVQEEGAEITRLLDEHQSLHYDYKEENCNIYEDGLVAEAERMKSKPELSKLHGI